MVGLPMSIVRALSGNEVAARLEAGRLAPAFLVFRDREGEQQIVLLETGVARVTLGRQAACDIALEWDPEVSRVHARVERVGSEWTLYDLGSRNGSYVNEVRVQAPRRLQHGDVVRVGRTQVMFQNDAPGGDANVTAPAIHAVETVVSPAQRRVLVELCRPFADSPYPTPAANGDIAKALRIDPETVKTHMRALFETFHIADVPQYRKRAELARVALESGVITPADLHHG